MAERYQQIKEWVKAKVDSLSRRTKIISVIAAVLFVFLIVFLILNFTKTEYVVLNRDLSPEQSGEMAAKLDENGIDYKVENNATAILVSEKQVDEARMKLALSGFTGSSLFDYEDAFNRISFTTSAETRNQLMLLAKQSSIANSLTFIQGIENASVELYVKKSSTFLNLEEDVSRASVLLTLKKDAELTKDQVDSIISFVVTAVEGLDESRVTVIDQNANKLNKDEDESNSYESNAQDELKVSIENRLNNTITDFLISIYGDGNVKVHSGVVLDFNAEVTEIEEFSPPIDGSEEGMLRSMEQLKEKVVNKSIAGPAGTDSNTTEIPEFPTGDDEKSGYEKQKNVMNYELNRMVKTIEKAKGQISDISVAIIVNTKALEGESLSEEDKTTLIELVKASAGFNETRNVRVMAREFAEEEVVPLEEPKAGFFGIPYWVWVAVLIGIIAVVVVTIVILRRRRKETEEVIEEIQTTQEELEEIQTDFEDKSSPKYQIEKFIDSRPEVVAQLIKSWMDSD